MRQPDVLRRHVEWLRNRPAVTDRRRLLLVEQPLGQEGHELLDRDLDRVALGNPQPAYGRAAKRFAVGVIERLDQGADVGAR